MIKKVFKYTVWPDDIVTLNIPAGAEILTVQSQYDQPQLWALVDPEAELETRRFRLAVTGHPIMYGPETQYKYIGTFQVHEGHLVFHLFEVLHP